MDEIAFIHDRYLTLRDAIAGWLRQHFRGGAWHYRPTPRSNSASWIVPHLIAFEQIKVYDQIEGHGLPPLVAGELVERYRPGAAGYAMPDAELASLDEALAGIARGREAADGFLSALRSGAKDVAGADRARVFDRFMLNFTHDTEHYGQLKYLSGTWERIATGR